MTDKEIFQTGLVSKFAQLLGVQSQTPVLTNGISSRECVSSTSEKFSDCLSDQAEFSDVVCTIPALEMKLDSKSKDDLPGVAESFHKVADKPAMAASVLDGSDTDIGRASCIEKEGIATLGALTSWTKSTLVYAPQAISKNVSTSFSSLVASRVRSWTLLLLRHSLTTGDATSRSRLLNMLSSKIEIHSTATSFKTLPLPESAKSHVKEADVILPLLFEANLSVSVQGKCDSVLLRAPGTVAGNFSTRDKPGLIRVDIRLDTNSLLESMVEQARMIVFKAVARATAVNTDSLAKPINNISQNHSQNVSSFNSVLNLSADAVAQSPQLQKARTSALRLNNVLHGKATAGSMASSLSKLRKNRSIHWENNLDVPRPISDEPPEKRQRLVQSQARLRSFRSFGRPHAGDGGREVKNATFGDFGRVPNGSIWGRDGKMAQHPIVGGGIAESRLSNLGITNQSSQQSNQNATFDLINKPKQMKRTATALESWLLQNATRR